MAKLTSSPALGSSVSRKAVQKALDGPLAPIEDSVSGTADGVKLNQLLAGMRALGLLGGSGFSPAMLFPAGTVGVWYDPSDLSTLWQDTAGTVPVTGPGDPVARLDDKSGNAFHALQATAAAQPTYQVSGDGHPYLNFDGVDDFLQAAFTISQPWDRVSALQQLSWTTAGDRLLSGGADHPGTLMQYPASPQLSLYDGVIAPGNGDLAVDVPGVVTERHNGASSALAVNNGAYVTGDSGTGVPGGITIGARFTGTLPGNFAFYGLVMLQGAQSDENIANLRYWLGLKVGLDL